MSNQDSLVEQHHEVLDLNRPVTILMVVANPTTHPVLGWPLGFWAAELTHPWVEFTDAGYKITVASPNGGKVMVDGLSDPRDPSRWSADDIVSLGFLSSPECAALLGRHNALGICRPGEIRCARGVRRAIAHVYIPRQPRPQERDPSILRIGENHWSLLSRRFRLG